MKSSNLLWCLAIAVAAGCACRRATPAPARRVILVSCDTLRADHLGAYGYALPTSPAVDAFAREALVFENAYSSAPWTGPSLSSLLTGRLPDEIGVPGGNRYPLRPEAVTIAEVVSAAGIPTAAVVSNWLLRRPDPSRGDCGVAQGFATFDDQMTTREKNREMFERSAPDTTSAAIRWLEGAKGKGDERFFLWVHYQDPHGPYAPPPELAAQFPPRSTGSAPLPIGATNKGKGQLPKYQVIDGERDPEFYRARYDAEIRSFDDGFGRLIEWLKANGWFDDALIVFTADHGESLGEHDYWFCHGENVYREVVHVPLIIHYPRGTSGPGVGKSTALVGHLDLWPTLIGAFGLQAAPNRGVSLLGATLPSGRLVPQTMGAPGSGARWVGITDEQYRLILPPRAPPQLYDLRADPFELADLAASHPEIVHGLAERYQAFLKSDARKSLQELPPTIDARGEGALQHLGYTDGDDPK